MSEQQATDVVDLTKTLVSIDSRNPFFIDKPDKEDPSTWRFKGAESEISRFIQQYLRA